MKKSNSINVKKININNEIYIFGLEKILYFFDRGEYNLPKIIDECLEKKKHLTVKKGRLTKAIEEYKLAEKNKKVEKMKTLRDEINKLKADFGFNEQTSDDNSTSNGQSSNDNSRSNSESSNDNSTSKPKGKPSQAQKNANIISEGRKKKKKQIQQKVNDAKNRQEHGVQAAQNYAAKIAARLNAEENVDNKKEGPTPWCRHCRVRGEHWSEDCPYINGVVSSNLKARTDFLGSYKGRKGKNKEEWGNNQRKERLKKYKIYKNLDASNKYDEHIIYNTRKELVKIRSQTNSEEREFGKELIGLREKYASAKKQGAKELMDILRNRMHLMEDQIDVSKKIGEDAGQGINDLARAQYVIDLDKLQILLSNFLSDPSGNKYNFRTKQQFKDFFSNQKTRNNFINNLKNYVEERAGRLIFVNYEDQANYVKENNHYVQLFDEMLMENDHKNIYENFWPKSSWLLANIMGGANNNMQREYIRVQFNELKRRIINDKNANIRLSAQIKRIESKL